MNESLFSSFGAPSGTPQRSILDQRLFTIFSNRIPLQVDLKVLLYAHNAEFYREVGATLDAWSLQANLDRLQQWSVVNNLPFNAGNCKVMHIDGRYFSGYILGEICWRE